MLDFDWNTLPQVAMRHSRTVSQRRDSPVKSEQSNESLINSRGRMVADLGIGSITRIQFMPFGLMNRTVIDMVRKNHDEALRRYQSIFRSESCPL